MATELRTILDQVAAGEISPEEGRLLLARLDAEGLAGDGPAGHAGGDESTAVRRVAVRVTGVRLTVVADPTVDTAIAEGDHRIERTGDLLVVHSDLSRGEYSTETLPSTLRSWINAGLSAGRRLLVRVNPHLPLEVRVTAGSLSLSGMRAPVTATVDAGSASFVDGRGPLSVAVTTGSADVAWEFTGRSMIGVELGSVSVKVLPGSDAVVTAEGASGTAQVRLKGAVGTKRGTATGGSITPVTVGAGTGILTVAARLGSADVVVP